MTIIILLDIIGFKKFLFFLPLFFQHNHLIFQFPKLILVFMSFLLVDVDHFVHDLKFLYKYSQIHFNVLVFHALHHALVPISDPLVCCISRRILSAHRQVCWQAWIIQEFEDRSYSGINLDDLLFFCLHSEPGVLASFTTLHLPLLCQFLSLFFSLNRRRLLSYVKHNIYHYFKQLNYHIFEPYSMQFFCFGIYWRDTSTENGMQKMKQYFHWQIQTKNTFTIKQSSPISLPLQNKKLQHSHTYQSTKNNNKKNIQKMLEMIKNHLQTLKHLDGMMYSEENMPKQYQSNLHRIKYVSFAIGINTIIGGGWLLWKRPKNWFLVFGTVTIINFAWYWTWVEGLFRSHIHDRNDGYAYHVRQNYPGGSSPNPRLDSKFHTLYVEPLLPSHSP